MYNEIPEHICHSRLQAWCFSAENRHWIVTFEVYIISFPVNYAVEYIFRYRTSVETLIMIII